MGTQNIVVVGCGSMANTWVKDALDRKDVNIVGLVDIHLDSAQAFATRFGLKCGLYTDLSKALKETKANLVFDITIPSSHYHVCSTAMEMGANVFGEKPMSESMENARKLIGIAERTGRSYFVMQNRRYSAAIRTLRDQVKEGKIGRVGYIGADFFIGPHFGGFRDVMDSPLILDMSIHTFDQARFLTGADPISVYCHEFNPPGSWYTGNASAICTFEMSNGEVFAYRGSWCSEGIPTSWDAEWRINGEKGTLVWDGASKLYGDVVANGDQSGKFIKDYERIEFSLDSSNR